MAGALKPQYGRRLDDFRPGEVYEHPWDVTLDAGMTAFFAASFQDATPTYASLTYARALGFRSILARTDERSVDDRLNTMLRRSEYMPFAPMVLAEDLDELFVGAEKMRQAMYFMTICAEARPAFKSLCPAVVHVDGTARPQALSASSNAFAYEVLREFKRETGIPALLNTSFNLHEEPIVCTPRDALLTSRAAGLDFLVLEDCLLPGNEAVARRLSRTGR